MPAIPQRTQGGGQNQGLQGAPVSSSVERGHLEKKEKQTCPTGFFFKKDIDLSMA